MNIIDISWPLDERTTAYKDKKTISFNNTKTFEKDGVRESIITIGSHSGTHIDAPAHFLKNGKTIDTIPLDQLTGPCKVIDLVHVRDVIEMHHLQEHDIEEGDFILIKTANSTLPPTAPFKEDFVYLSAAAAYYLVDCGIELIGFDYLGIERNQPAHDTHTLLMQADIAIVEGLRLAKVRAGEYLFVCLPLLVVGLDAAPARAILVADI